MRKRHGITGALIIALLLASASPVTAVGSSGADVDAYGLPLLANTRDIKAQSWLPDGSGFVYSKELPGLGTELRVRSLATGADTLLVPDIGPSDYLGKKLGQYITTNRVMSARVSPDGRFLAYEVIRARERLMPGAYNPPVVKKRTDLDAFSLFSAGKDQRGTTVWIVDLSSGKRLNLTAAAKRSSTLLFRWLYDNASGLLLDCSTMQRTGCLPRVVRFNVAQGTASLKPSEGYEQVTWNGLFALLRRTGAAESYVKNMKTGAVLGRMDLRRVPAGVRPTQLSPDGTQAWAEWRNDAKSGRLESGIYDTKSGKRLRTFTTPGYGVFSFDGTRLLASSDDAYTVVPTDGPGVPALVQCPNTRSADPATYDRCWAGFQVPGMVGQVIKCERTTDPNLVFVTVRLSLLGGQYRQAWFQEELGFPTPTPVIGLDNPLSNSLPVIFGSALGTSGKRYEDALRWSATVDGALCTG